MDFVDNMDIMDGVETILFIWFSWRFITDLPKKGKEHHKCLI